MSEMPSDKEREGKRALFFNDVHRAGSSTRKLWFSFIQVKQLYGSAGVLSGIDRTKRAVS